METDFGPYLSPTDPAERLTPVVEAFTALIVRSEAQQRSMLRVSLNEDTAGRSALPLRQGSEKLLPARNVRWNVRSLGERGILAAVDAVLVARPPVSDFIRRPAAEERIRLRAEQRDVVAAVIGRYNPDAVICVGIPFDHTRPQWIVPHGGAVTVDGSTRRVFADYS